MNIIIPMAGKSSRFSAKGFKEPKPFITFMGKMMIEHVLDGLPLEEADITLISQETFKDTHKTDLIKLQEQYNASLSFVEKPTAGAACTALSVHAHINSEKSVLFVDSDNIFKAQDLRSMIATAKQRSLDGSLLTFPSKEGFFSYVEVDKKGYAIRLYEKEAISSHAIAGAYYFSCGKDFVDSAIKMMIYSDTTKGEFYMSNVYNYMIQAGKKISYFEITQDRFSCVGTPQQLEEYLEQ